MSESQFNKRPCTSQLTGCGDDPIQNTSQAQKWNTEDKQPVVIDTDAGIDDAYAIFMMLSKHESITSPMEIAAITCSFGNTSVENVCCNVQRILLAAGNVQIPIYKGCAQPFLSGFQEDPPYHGKDGFGDVAPSVLTALEPSIQPQHAVTFLSSIPNVFPQGVVNLLCLAPLTNLATALVQEPRLANWLKGITIKGGNLHGWGSVTTCGEFNFSADPESAKKVLNGFQCPMTIISSDTHRLVKTSEFRHFRVTELAEIASSKMRLLTLIEKSLLERVSETWTAPDAVASAIFIDPTIITKLERHYCTVQLEGIARAMLIIDRRGHQNKDANVDLVLSFDEQRYKELLIEAVSSGPS